ncbi:MAG: putative acyl-CoA dehydrogenase, partial [Actinomycetota bacterium]
MAAAPDLEQFRAEARVWLSAHARPRAAAVDPASAEWGVGSDDVAVFHNLAEDVERDRLLECRRWQQAKFDAGYAMINWPEALGGRGLPNSYLRAYNNEEARFEVPNGGELPPTSMGLIATTVAAFGTPEQQQRFIR